MKAITYARIKSAGLFTVYLLSLEANSSDKTLDVYSSVAGALGNSVTRMLTRHMGEGLKKSKHIFQCSGALPIGLAPHILGPLTQVKHTWIKSFGKTYGMPFTLSKSYFGGDAMIMNPDPFVSKNLIHESSIICDPITYHPRKNEEEHEEKVACIIDKISKDTSNEAQGSNDWVAILDYHALVNNCASAVRFAMDCTSSQISQTPNFNIGSFYDADGDAKIGLPVNALIYNSIFDTLEELKSRRRGEYIKKISHILELKVLITEYLDALEMTKTFEDDYKLSYNTRKYRSLFVETFNNLGLHIYDQELLRLSQLIETLPKYRFEKTTYSNICYKARLECE